MVVDSRSIGKDVYYYDQKIKKNLINNGNIEKIISEYKLLKKFKKNASDEFNGEIDNLLIKTNKIINDKLKSKNDQVNLFLTLLEYINTLDIKIKNLESDKILLKIKELEEEIINLRKLFN